MIRLVYVGTLGHSYNLTIVFDAIRLLRDSIRNRIEFIIMGDGPRKAEFEKQAKGLPVRFTDRLPYPDMVWILARCDIAVNPITRGAAQSIINKHADYAMTGLPVINTQESNEYRYLISKYGCGINCGCESAQQVANAIEQLVENDSLRYEMGKNAMNMAKELFDRKK